MKGAVPVVSTGYSVNTKTMFSVGKVLLVITTVSVLGQFTEQCVVPVFDTAEKRLFYSRSPPHLNTPKTS